MSIVVDQKLVANGLGFDPRAFCPKRACTDRNFDDLGGLDGEGHETGEGSRRFAAGCKCDDGGLLSLSF